MVHEVDNSKAVMTLVETPELVTEEEALICTPLAVVRPEAAHIPELVLGSEVKEDISVWVSRRVKGFGRFLGVSCVGYESMYALPSIK